MSKKTIPFNLGTLTDLLQKHTVMVPLGYTGFAQPFIKAPELFDEIHLCSTLHGGDKDEFIRYVNAMAAKDWKTRDEFERIKEIDTVFQNVQYPGVFKEVGHEVLNNNPYIRHDRIDKVITGLKIPTTATDVLYVI